MNPTLSSSAFAHQGAIPGKYTCEGADLSPPLSWSGLPPGTKSLALIVDDPDAPGLPEGASALPAGTLQGINDWKRTGYGGPCPPIGRHRYFHKLYALDTVLPDLGRPTKATLAQAMKGHILGQAELVGTYQKRR